MKSCRLVGLVTVLYALPALAAEPQRAALIVYGPGFSFSVTEPSGWAGDTEHAARFAANVVFLRRDESVRQGALIRIRVNGKMDENTAEDLKADMDGYRAERPKVRFEELALDHPRYATFPKLFFEEGVFYEYVAYLNPGKDVPLLLSVSMHVPKVRATAEELAAFRGVLQSIVVYPGVEVREVPQKAPPQGGDAIEQRLGQLASRVRAGDGRGAWAELHALFPEPERLRGCADEGLGLLVTELLAHHWELLGDLGRIAEEQPAWLDAALAHLGGVEGLSLREVEEHARRCSPPQAAMCRRILEVAQAHRKALEDEKPMGE